jgi:anti-sigma regulatory factor (Ser/Thr protein kinase)/HAMP domain-containing protein
MPGPGAGGVAAVRITRKLGLLVSVPLVAVLGFAALAVITTGGQAVRADGLRRLVVAAAAAGELAHRLQMERASAVVELTDGSAGLGVFAERVAATDLAVGGYQRSREALPELPAGTAAVLERVDGQLLGLVGLRGEVVSGSGRVSAAAFRYRILIADLIGFRELVGQAGGAPADVADRLRAASALSQATELVGLQQVAVLRAASFGPLTSTSSQEITSARTGRIEALLRFEAFSTVEWRELLEASAAGEDALAAQQLEDQVARTPVGGRLRVDSVEWTDALSGRMARLRQVEARVDADVLTEVSRLRDGQRRLTSVQVAGVVAAVVVALVVAWVLGRPVVGGLRRLRDAAHQVAYEGLPAAVAALEHREGIGGLSPDEFADRVPAPVPVRGRDELAEVAAAFNRVHRAAVRTAAEQAQLRLNVAAIMLALARRGQRLTGRLTAALDEVERSESDPQRLKQLFELDLAATLLGGTNESLLVLGGGGTAIVRAEDEPLARVLRAAQGRVEQYQRIDLGVVDDGVAVRAGVVDDVVKLLAELLDNACQFSNPATPVTINARWLSDRVVVQVADQGPGITPPGRLAELNRRLASRPPLDLQAVKAMGLTVVAYLADRHRIRVELREGHGVGTLAEVMLPAELVRVTAGIHLPAPPVVSPRRVSAGPAVSLVGHREGYLPAGRPGWPLWSLESAGPNPDLVAAAGGWDAAATRELPLPIYESVCTSQWFTPTSPPELAEAAGATTGLSGGGPVAAAGSWRTAADEGWRAAARAAVPRPVDVTHGGLPVRRPGAQLVPGGVATPPVAALGGPVRQWRDPARARAVAAAYSRGLAAGRARHPAVPVSQAVDAQGDRTR